MIEARSLVRRYGKIEAVRGIDLYVSKGEIAGLLGPNGAGKSTVLRLLTGVLFPNRGSVKIDGVELQQDPVRIKQRIGYLPENAPVYDELNVTEHLDFIARTRGLVGTRKKQAMEEVCEACGLTDALYRPLGYLSKGFRQRTALAAALIHNPQILILDEPTTGLDPRQIREIRDLIRTLGKDRTVLLSTHILQEAEALCSRLMILNQGLIVADAPPGEITGAAQSGSSFRVAVKGLKPDELDRHATEVPGFRSEGPAEAGDLGSEIVLHSDNSGADGSQIFNWAVNKGLQLCALQPIYTSLEERFLAALKEGDSE